MILHLGDDIYVYKENILVILDKNSMSKVNRSDYFSKLGKNIIYGNFNEDEIKSYIILNINNEISYYASRISSRTLKNRCGK